MPYDVVAYEADEAAMMLTPEQEGLFHRLLRRAWMNGSIPDDVDKCSKICRVTKFQMRRAWPALRPLWLESVSEPGRLLNAKQEREREWKGRYTHEQAKRGRLGGIAKALRNKESDVASAKQALQVCQPSAVASPSPIPIPPLPLPSRLIHNSSLLVSPTEEKPSARPRDLAADFFCEKCLEFTKTPYVAERGDFVQLAKLRKAFQTPAREPPPGWEEAVANYFATPNGQVSLADLSNPKRYAVYRVSPIDGYGKPMNHKNRHGKEKETHAERVARHNRETKAEFDLEFADGDVHPIGPTSGEG